MIRDALSHPQTGLLTLLTPGFAQLPPFAGPEACGGQNSIAHGVAHVLHVLGPLRTPTILRRPAQRLDVLLLGNHDPKMLFFARKRKS